MTRRGLFTLAAPPFIPKIKQLTDEMWVRREWHEARKGGDERTWGLYVEYMRGLGTNVPEKYLRLQA